MAGKIFTIAQQKGGAGKTTLAIHLAVAWLVAGHRVALLDIDPQASLTLWHRLRQARLGEDGAEPHLSSLAGWRVAGEAEKLARDHDVVLIDSPPHAETEARLAVRAAAQVLIPVQPSILDLWATRATLDLAKEEGTPAVIVLNRVPPRSVAGDDVAAEAHKLGFPVAANSIGNRVALSAAVQSGYGIGEWDRASQAGQEIAALAQELMG
jgi:chromosome partitioning protein